MYVHRDLEDHFLKSAKRYPIVALVGPRQAGKTTMLKELMRKRNSSYVLFDDPDARRIFDQDVKKFAVQYMNGYALTVLDEIQYCKDSGSKLKFLADSGYRMWVTLSSEILLSKNVLSYLVGRVSIHRLYPFSINEFLRARGYKITDKEILKRNVWEHALFGGFPRVILEESVEMKREYLRNLHETMILKDAVRTFSIDDIGAIERLSKYIAINSGSLFSYTNVANMLNLSFHTLRKYVDALEKSEIIISIPPFFTNRSREITKQPKIYFLDTGLRNSVAGSYPTSMDSALFENYVLSELLKMGYKPKYWRTKSKAEVDFIVEKEEEIIPIEVKLKSSMKVERSMRSFIEKYNPKRAIVVLYTGEKGEIKINSTKIYFDDILGLWWMLGEKTFSQ